MVECSSSRMCEGKVLWYESRTVTVHVHSTIARVGWYDIGTAMSWLT